MDSSSSVNRLRYTAFLYAEYVLRNIERANPELVEFLKNFKEYIKEYAIKYKEYARAQAKTCNKKFDENVCVDENIILDSVLELECYYHSTDYDCELFCGACLNKYSLRPECKNETFIEIVEDIQKDINPKNDNDYNDYIYKNFKKIVELSLSEGVYITHLDSFRQKEYYYKDVPENLPASYFFQDIFFKSDKAFWGDSKLIDYKAPSSSPYENEDQAEKAWEDMESIKLFTKEEAYYEDLLETNFTIFIPVYDKNINLKNILDQVNSVVIAFQLNSIERVLGDYSKYKHFINRFFKKDIYRNSKSEFKNRILYILLWDEYALRSNQNLRLAIENLYKKYKIHINNKCEYDKTTPCTRECASDTECDKNIQHMFEATKKSIDMKRITTSKE